MSEKDTKIEVVQDKIEARIAQFVNDIKVLSRTAEDALLREHRRVANRADQIEVLKADGEAKDKRIADLAAINNRLTAVVHKFTDAAEMWEQRARACGWVDATPETQAASPSKTRKAAKEG